MVKLRWMNAVVVAFFISTLAAVSVFGQSDPSDTSSTEADQGQASEAAPPSSSETNVQSSPTTGELNSPNTSSISAPGSSANPQRCPAFDSGCTQENIKSKVTDRLYDGLKDVVRNPSPVGKAVDTGKMLLDCTKCGLDVVVPAINSFHTTDTPSRAPNSIDQPPPSASSFGEAVTEEQQVEQQQEQEQQQAQEQQRMEDETQRRVNATAKIPEPYYHDHSPPGR